MLGVVTRTCTARIGIPMCAVHAYARTHERAHALARNFIIITITFTIIIIIVIIIVIVVVIFVINIAIIAICRESDRERIEYDRVELWKAMEI